MQIRKTPAPIHPHGVGEELLSCPESWALSRSSGGVSCKPASAPGWLLGLIKVTHFPQDGKGMLIFTCLFDVRSAFDTAFWHLCGGAEPALLRLWGMGWASTSVGAWERE